MGLLRHCSGADLHAVRLAQLVPAASVAHSHAADSIEPPDYSDEHADLAPGKPIHNHLVNERNADETGRECGDVIFYRGSSGVCWLYIPATITAWRG